MTDILMNYNNTQSNLLYKYVLSYFFTSILIIFCTHDISLLLLWLLFALFSNCFLIFFTKSLTTYKIVNIVYILYSLYTIFTHILIIKNPTNDYFIAFDQTTFYEVALDVSSVNWDKIVSYVFSTIKYLEYSLYAVYIGFITKIGHILKCDDILLLLKFSTVTFGCLISAILYECAKIYKTTTKEIILFSLFCPALLEFSVMLMRDIHICFLFTLMIYFSLTHNCKFRYLKLILLAIFITFIRYENGLFALSFIILRFYISSKNTSIYKKVIFILFIVVILTLSVSFLWSTAFDTLSFYQERDLDDANINSLGAKLKLLPIPLNLILPAIFSQIMPFPFWAEIIRDNGGYLLVYTPICSIYWLGIWISIIFSIKKYYSYIKLQYKELFLLLIISSAYIVMTASGELNPRRIMAIYPTVFLIYSVFSNRLSFNQKLIVRNLSITILLTLHIVYILIK